MIRPRTALARCRACRLSTTKVSSAARQRIDVVGSFCFDRDLVKNFPIRLQKSVCKPSIKEHVR